MWTKTTDCWMRDLYMGYWGSLPGVMRTERGVYHPIPIWAEIKDRLQLYPYYPSGLRLNFTLPFQTKWKEKFATPGNCQQFSLPEVRLNLKHILCCSVPPLCMYVYELHVVLTRGVAFTRRLTVRDEPPVHSVRGTTVAACLKVPLGVLNDGTVRSKQR